MPDLRLKQRPNMPNLRPSTLKQRPSYVKPKNARTQKHTIRGKRFKSSRSSSSINHGLGTMSRLPFEIRQAIFEQIVPAETPLTVNEDGEMYEVDERDEVKGSAPEA